ncbi:hypothetical protein, partial [Corallococcus terminator]
TLSHVELASVLFVLALTAVLLLYRAFLLGWFNHVVPFLTGIQLTPDTSSLPSHAYDITEAIRRRPPQHKFVGMTPVARRFRPLSWEPVYLSEQDQSMHRHVMGQTGSGKTLSVIWPSVFQDLLDGKGVIAISAKGSDEEISTIKGLCAV